MLLQFIFFAVLFFVLFFLGLRLTQSMYHTFLLFTKSKKFALYTLLIILLPGTIIHELSHFLIATLLFVPVGKISIFPEVEEGSVKAGSVHHAQTDILRRTLIGVSPIIIGLLLINFIGGSLLGLLNNFDQSFTSSVIIIMLCYILLVTSLTMFSSKKDLETTWFLLPLILLIILSLYFAGVRVGFTNQTQKIITEIVKNLNISLFVTLIINCVGLLIAKLIKTTAEKTLKRRIV